MQGAIQVLCFTFLLLPFTYTQILITTFITVDEYINWVAVCRYQIYQSAFAVLGHVLAHETAPTDPAVDVFLDVIRCQLETPGKAHHKLRGNALWALVHAVANQSASEDRLLGFVEPLISIFERTDGDPSCIVNAAWAMTSICGPRAADQIVVDVTTRPDVFLHLSGLLRAQFPRSLEKLAIFTNFIRMLTPAIDKVCRKFILIKISQI